jgi:hypothetical protein
MTTWSLDAAVRRSLCALLQRLDMQRIETMTPSLPLAVVKGCPQLGRSRRRICQHLLWHPHADECSLGPSDSSVRRSPLRWSPIRMSLPPTNSPLMYSCTSGSAKAQPPFRQTSP